MESRIDEANSRSLPPLVEGKVHGFLRLIIDEIVWSRRSPGDVTVLASWWGELDSAQFRPADIKCGVNRPEGDITEIYAIRTNFELFDEYLGNCETIELVVISEKNHQVVGTARVAELTNLLNGKSYFQYVPIINDNGSRIGDIHVTMKLTSYEKNPKNPMKKPDSKITQDNAISSRGTGRFDTIDTMTIPPFVYENDVPVSIKNAKQHENVYRSILKERRLNPENSGSRSFNGINDKLVGQLVARAQRLRGAILKEARDEDPLALSSEGSTMDSQRSDLSMRNEANLYEYFIGKKMSRSEEKKAIEALRTTSPTPSLIDLAAETIRTCRNEKNFSIRSVKKSPSVESAKASNDISLIGSEIARPSDSLPIDYVDSLRIAVESLTLSSAGYRRVRSSCLSRGDGIPLSVTYFVQYDSTFGRHKKFNKKIINDSKPVKLCSKKQVGQIVYFNHEAVYDLPKTYLSASGVPLRFKIFNRHLNQRTPTELGIGSMHIADATRARSLSSTQRLAIVNKGIKIGELKVTAELGCDRIHFGKQFVDAITSAKENIPVLEVSSVSSLETPRYRTATGSESKENAKPSSSSGNKANDSWRINNTDRTEKRETSQRRDPRDEDRIHEQEDRRRELDEKILLHGLIYVAEGKYLSSMCSYLVCRAFWREDRETSRVCDETNNPFYNFHQLVPLVLGQDLLERTRNNCIVIEIYSRCPNNERDELLGISKLSLHPLYLAYKDPQVLPHLLASKYPVISVDEWITIAHPVTGRSCGQIHGLVALGTADQIAHLEMTRGLRDSGVISRKIDDPTRIIGEFSRATEFVTADMKFSQNHENSSSLNERARREYDNYHVNSDNIEERGRKSAACQTEITTFKYFKPDNVEERLNSENPQTHALNAIVDRLAQALNVPKSSADQAAQTEIDPGTRNSDETTKIRTIEPLNLNNSIDNGFSADSSSSNASNSDADSQRDNFLPSSEIYRSVGVGAEFDDSMNHVPGTSYANTNFIAISDDRDAPRSAVVDSPERKNENSKAGFNDEIIAKISATRLPVSVTNETIINTARSDNENSSFRAVVEIECALHLPRIEKIDETAEPCTYVTFQKARNQNVNQYGCYVVTNLYPFSCSPKWDWRCDTRLSNDLLDNEEKRLILKVWRLVDPETSMEINLERDIVIGFSAIDVSVLTVGFPVVSGWFHVMDFTGKCNGQIKVSVTPLDNIAGFAKITCQTSATRSALPDFDRSNFSSPYPADFRNNGEALNSGHINQAARSQADNEPMMDIGLNLGDASMSFLSLSLKQKLTELDEIKKRLQTRLRDVTNTAFDDDFDNDFDTPVADDDENYVANNGNTDDTRNALRVMENWQIPCAQMINANTFENCATTNANRSRNVLVDDRANHQRATSNSACTDGNITDTGYSTSSNVQSSRNFSNGNLCNAIDDDNRFNSRHTSEENTNGHNVIAINADRPNLTNNHCTARQAYLKNQTDSLNAINYLGADNEIQNFSAIRDNDDDDVTANIAITVNDRSRESIEDYPIRGTRMHISHLLDKLTSQLSAVPSQTTNQPMKRNIMDLITSLRRNNNNFTNDAKCNREINVRTVPTQTEITNYQREASSMEFSNGTEVTRENLISRESQRMNRENATGSKSPRRFEKVSSVVREELLAACDANETLNCDELSTHLMTTNVRHMDLRGIFNASLYSNLVPEIRTNVNDDTTRIDSVNTTAYDPREPEVEAIERLDTRYTENFHAKISDYHGRSRIGALNEITSASCGEEIAENDEIFRMIGAGISENYDGNIDVTVIHGPCNDELMASNSAESTTTISLDDDPQNITEIDDNGSFNSTVTSVSGFSRQAPDGCNPIEETGTSVIVKPRDRSQDSSSTS